MRSRTTLPLILMAGGVLLLGLIAARGVNPTWGLWGIPVGPCRFLDASGITAAAESYAHGHDPLHHNPADPMARPLNYPRTIYALFPLGLDRTHTDALALGIAALFVLGTVAALGRVNVTEALAVALVFFSPATLFCVERGNFDLFVFALVCAAVLAARRNVLLAALGLLLGFTIKLYPLFGLLLLLRVRRRTVGWLAGVSLLYVLLYGLLHASDLVAIRAATPRDCWYGAYGIDVFWRGVAQAFEARRALVQALSRPLSYALAGGLLGAVAWAWWRRGPPARPPESAHHLDCFRAGAGIYAGTFLLGTNHDYRLIFLLLCVPQLVAWSRGSGRDRVLTVWARITLAAVLGSCWQLLWQKWLAAVPTAALMGFTLGQAAKWVVFAGFLFLLQRSAPTRAEFRRDDSGQGPRPGTEPVIARAAARESGAPAGLWSAH